MTTFYLSHHGIKGQRKGIQNGPPYPLNRATHNRVVNYGKSDSAANNKRSSNTELSKYVIDRASGVNPEHHTDNCKEVAYTVASNIAFDRHDIATGRLMDGNLRDFMEALHPDIDPKYYIREKRPDNPNDVKQSAVDFIKRNYNDGAVGMIGVTFDRSKLLDPDNDINAHAFDWIIEDNNVKFLDGQSNKASTDKIDNFFNSADPSKDIEYVLFDNSGPRKEESLKELAHFY